MGNDVPWRRYGGAEYIPNALGSQLVAWADTGNSGNAYDRRQPLARSVPWEQRNAEQQTQAMEEYHMEC